MRKAILTALFASAAGAMAAGPAAAHDYLYHPYVVEKRCDDDGVHCRVRMNYAPHEHAGLAGAGSYWYRNPGQGHYHLVEIHHKWHGDRTSRHVQWCLDRYRTYDPHTDTFVGRGYRTYRCNSPYDGV
jgi:hypothetical protein